MDDDSSRAIVTYEICIVDISSAQRPFGLREECIYIYIYRYIYINGIYVVYGEVVEFS